jgi:hypothetical protein
MVFPSREPPRDGAAIAEGNSIRSSSIFRQHAAASLELNRAEAVFTLFLEVFL